MKQILIFLTFLLFTACGQPAYSDDNKTEFYPDYRTSDVRFIWHHCHQGLMKRGNLPELHIWAICDCFTDTLRSSVPRSEFEVMGEQEQYYLSLRSANYCIQNTLMPAPVDPI